MNDESQHGQPMSVNTNPRTRVITYKGRNMRGFYFSSMDLTSCDLSKKDLRDANFRNAILISANLSNADISGADFSDADLTGANLERVSGKQTIFHNAKLSSASMYKAALRLSNFNSANLSGCNAELSDCREADFAEADLTAAKFSGADLHKCKLARVIAKGAVLSGVNLGDAHLGGADFSFADLTGSKLSGTDFETALVDGARFWWVHGLPFAQKQHVSQHGGSLYSPGREKCNQILLFFMKNKIAQAGLALVSVLAILMTVLYFSFPQFWSRSGLLNSAYYHDKAGAHDDAVRLFSMAYQRDVIKNRIDYRLLFDLAMSLRAVQRNDEAIRIYDRLKNANQSVIKPGVLYIESAFAHSDSNNLEAAAQDFRYILSELDQGDVDRNKQFSAFRGLAEVYVRQNKAEQALNLYDQMKSRFMFRPEWALQIRLGRAQTLFALNRFQAAMDEFRLFLDDFKEPAHENDLLQAIQGLANCFENLNDHAGALSVYSKWNQKYRQNPGLQAQLGYQKAIFLRELGHLPEAEQAYREIIEQPAQAAPEWIKFESLLELMNIKRSAGKRQEALKGYNDMLLLYQNDPEQLLRVRFEKANTYFDSGMTEKAKPEYDSILNEFSKDGAEWIISDSKIRLLRIKQWAGEVESCLKGYEEMIAQYGHSTDLLANIYFNKAGLHAAIDRMDEAKKQYGTVLALLSNQTENWLYFQSHIELANLRIQAGENEKALSDFKELLSIYSDSGRRADIEYRIGELYLSLSQFEKAEAQFKTILQQYSNPNNFHILFRSKLNLINIKIERSEFAGVLNRL